jgi:hypothetical protein
MAKAAYKKLMKPIEKTQEGGMDPPFVCRYCKHLNWTPYSRDNVENARLDADTVYTCAAFESGIPTRLYDGFAHDEPIEGDTGIQFEQSEDAPPAPWK